jgi:hypothetical protein
MYLAMYITDGDNIQYMQGAMKNNWDAARDDRGKVALNWTIAPGLVDMGPGILNYYYTTASDYECFVAGPSGMGYIMPINTLEEREGNRLTATAATFLTDSKYMDDYTRLTQRYLERSGTRVVTIWDDANEDVKASYQRNCRYLYGATIQAFGRGNVVPTVVNDRLHFSKHSIHYESNVENFERAVTNHVSATDANRPLFYTYQLDGWFIRTHHVVSLHEKLRDNYGNSFEFVRADHYYSYYNEAHGLPFNLNMLQSTQTSTSDKGSNTDALSDGTPSTVWTSSKGKNKYVQFKFDREYSISRYVLRLAESSGLPSYQNATAWTVEVSSNGRRWKTIDKRTNNNSAIVDIDIEATNARFVRISFTDTKKGETVTVADVEIYGAVI